MSNRSRISALATGLLLLFVVVGCGGNTQGASSGGGQTANNLPTVSITGVDPSLVAVTMSVIEEQGFDEQNGFHADFTYSDSGSGTQIFLQNKEMVAYDFGALNSAVARSQGYNVTTVWGGRPNGACILVREDSAYRTPDDLIGKTVGHYGHDSGGTTTLAGMLKRFENLDIFSQYNLVENSPTGLVELLDKGEVEAIIDYVPFSTRAIEQVPARCLYGPVADTWPKVAPGKGTLYFGAITAHEELLRKQPEMVAAAIAAWDDATAWIKEDPSRITEEPYASHLGAERPEVIQRVLNDIPTAPLLTSRWTAGDRKAAKTMIGLAAEQGRLFTEPPGGAVSDIESYLPPNSEIKDYLKDGTSGN